MHHLVQVRCHTRADRFGMHEYPWFAIDGDVGNADVGRDEKLQSAPVAAGQVPRTVQVAADCRGTCFGQGGEGHQLCRLVLAARHARTRPLAALAVLAQLLHGGVIALRGRRRGRRDDLQHQGQARDRDVQAVPRRVTAQPLR
ncbi:MAG: hypothetical protein ACREO8_11345 [Luteimonas sp.]